MNESELITAARRGDQAVWVELVRLHQQAVFRLAYLQLGDTAEAEDAAQECMIRAFRSLRQFEDGRPLRPWLLRIVSNLASNRRRSLGRYWAALQRSAQEQPATGADLGGEGEVWSAVKKLSQKEQKLIYLRYFLDLSVEECAQALSVAEGTVKSQTHRTLQRLRMILEKE